MNNNNKNARQGNVKSKYRLITWHRGCKKWMVQGKAAGKSKVFDDEEEAAKWLAEQTGKSKLHFKKVQVEPVRTHSVHKGVSWDPRAKKWVAQGQVNSQKFYQRFSTEQEAISHASKMLKLDTKELRKCRQRQVFSTVFPLLWKLYLSASPLARSVMFTLDLVQAKVNQ